MLHHSRLDQLLLRDDPTFLPELAFLGAVEDLSNLDIKKDDPSQSNSFLSASGRSSLPGLGLELPSDSGFPEGDDEFQLRSDAASRIGRLSSTALKYVLPASEQYRVCADETDRL